MTNRERYIKLLGGAIQGPNEKIQVRGHTEGEISKVLDAAKSDLAYLKDLEGRAKEVEDYVRRAIEDYADEGRIEIDPDAQISEVDDVDSDTPGAWVQAWVWVPASSLKHCPKCGKIVPEPKQIFCDDCNKNMPKANK